LKGALKGHSEHWEMRRKVFYNLGPAYEILVVNGGSPIFLGLLVLMSNMLGISFAPYLFGVRFENRYVLRG
jgi:hypothetical protein